MLFRSTAFILFPFIFFPQISVLLCVSTLKKIAQGQGGKRRETTLRVGDEKKSSMIRVGDESLNFEISNGLVREKTRLI